MEIFPFHRDFPHLDAGSNRLNRLGANLADGSPRAIDCFHAAPVIDPKSRGLGADLRRLVPFKSPIGPTWAARSAAAERALPPTLIPLYTTP